MKNSEGECVFLDSNCTKRGYTWIPELGDCKEGKISSVLVAVFKSLKLKQVYALIVPVKLKVIYWVTTTVRRLLLQAAKHLKNFSDITRIIWLQSFCSMLSSIWQYFLPKPKMYVSRRLGTYRWYLWKKVLRRRSIFRDRWAVFTK